MKRFAILGVVALALASVVGCAETQAGLGVVEDAVMHPPTVVVSAGKTILDFVLSLFGIFAQGALGGWLK